MYVLTFTLTSFSYLNVFSKKQMKHCDTLTSTHNGQATRTNMQLNKNGARYLLGASRTNTWVQQGAHDHNGPDTFYLRGVPFTSPFGVTSPSEVSAPRRYVAA